MLKSIDNPTGERLSRILLTSTIIGPKEIKADENETAAKPGIVFYNQVKIHTLTDKPTAVLSKG